MFKNVFVCFIFVFGIFGCTKSITKIPTYNPLGICTTYLVSKHYMRVEVSTEVMTKCECDKIKKTVIAEGCTTITKWEF